MSDLLANLKERHIWRVLIVYPSVTFIWLQAVEFFINNYDLDSRLLTASLLAAIVLFPAAVVWNWQHGESGSQRFSRSEVASYVFIGIASIAVVGWYWTATPASTRPMMATNEIARSVAVLPFQNEGDNAEVQFLCDGIAESLINWLATVPDIKVASKSASFRMRDDAIDATDVAEALGVDAIITGNLEQVGDQIVISVSMIDVSTVLDLFMVTAVCEEEPPPVAQ